MQTSTIAAISTAYGESGIGIVRMSGPASLDILGRIFSGGPVTEPRHMYYGKICRPEDGSEIDEVLAVYMKAPASYTGEDVAEIQCHGGMLSVKKILELCLDQGAEPAERGEFTKRAFLNGRLDLSQAEAVIDLIKARSGAAYGTAVSQLSGTLSARVREIRSDLLEQLVQLTVNMDYPDEDVEPVTYENLAADISVINDKILKLLEFSREGRIVREGLSVAICGKPNVGKSSLMNLLLRSDRSIVTDVPGTTRDTVEEDADIRGIRIRFIDTAGVRETDDAVETLGIERSRSAMDSADLVLAVFDASSPEGEEDREIIRAAEGRPHIYVLNKCDIAPGGAELPEEPVRMSCRTGEGLGALEDAIEGSVFGGRLRREEDLLVTNVRHINLLGRASEELSQALEMIKGTQALDFIEVNVRAAYDALGEITGDTAGDDVIEEVFSRFCLGK